MFNLLLIAPICSLLGLAFAGYLIFSILRSNEGTEEMTKISKAIREGAKAYIKRQYMGVSVFLVAVFVILLILSIKNFLTVFAPFAFLTGGLLSALAGYIGMTVAVNSNSRTTYASQTSLNKGLRVAFSSGMVMGLVVVGLALLFLSLWYLGLDYYYTVNKPENITSALLCFSMGASSVALFARVGGGIFTKAADVGSDLVGKVEKGIPEDDPRNAAVIADQVGDNVGDVAGMGADLYESYAGAIVAGIVLAFACGLGHGIILPLSIAGVGIIASIIGSFLVRSKGEQVEQRVLLNALRRGIYIASLLVAIFAFIAIYYIVGIERIGLYYAVLAGLAAGLAIGLITEYYTSQKYKPTRFISHSAETGAGTVIIAGLSVGMLSTILPILAISAATLASYFLAGGASNPTLGLFAISLSGVGMLSTLGITLATDAYGPVADNAGGIAQMAKLDPKVRERTDALDALGNTTAATGKGFAIGSAALTALALIVAYKEKVSLGSDELSIANPKLLAGVFIGGMLPFIFCALTMRAVSRTAGSIVLEVRRQFKELQGIMEGTTKPDYARAVDICTKSAQKEMVVPALLAVMSPLVVGLILGTNALLGLLVGALVTGFLLATTMANSGGAWDNAKKYIEGGRLGGKGSLAHKASVTGDTVGDPFKDTAGPSLNILIKLMSIVSLVFASVIVAYKIW
ncbi:MAG: sodium-translocating pyrophosphatase [Candidatus Thermoplasmatota archaeon]|nr:sodium-translocating pyrophosphatase [Candidatus Thermoplasmatota archaeon]MDI6887534.1 sodium-translocating pyrophosphatase [Candidatus Thermoplasmatota archaeon]